MRRSHDDGFTLIEMAFTLALAGILMTLGLFTLRGYLLSARERGTATDVRSTLRMAGERALAEGRTYCVKFTASQWTLYKGDCSTGTAVGGASSVQDSRITIGNVSFPAPATPVAGQSTSCPTTSGVLGCAFFYPRGTALAGSLTVSRSSKTYTITVEGLTGRVSMA